MTDTDWVSGAKQGFPTGTNVEFSEVNTTSPRRRSEVAILGAIHIQGDHAGARPVRAPCRKYRVEVAPRRLLQVHRSGLRRGTARAHDHRRRAIEWAPRAGLLAKSASRPVDGGGELRCNFTCRRHNLLRRREVSSRDCWRRRCATRLLLLRAANSSLWTLPLELASCHCFLRF